MIKSVLSIFSRCTSAFPAANNRLFLGKVPYHLEKGIVENGTGAITMEGHFFESQLDPLYERNG